MWLEQTPDSTFGHSNFFVIPEKGECHFLTILNQTIMKKIYLLLVAICYALVSNAQVYLSEDFSSGAMPPSGWSFDGLPDQWSNSNTTSADGTAPEAKFTYIDQTATSRFVSPVVDMTGINSATLVFKYFYDWYGTGPKIGVATRFGTSGDWNVVWEETPTGNQGPETKVLELTNIGQSNFQFCFYISGYLYDVDYWYIDNVKLLTPLTLDAALATIVVPKFVQNEDSIELTGKISNEGTDALTSFDIVYTLDNGAPQNMSVTGVNVPFYGDTTFTHDVPIVLSGIGNHEVKVWVANPNNGNDLNPSNDTLTAVAGVVTFVPEKKVLAEEATGTWCGFCVRGICYMDYMGETYPDTWIGVAIHHDDPMVEPDYDNAMSQGLIVPGFYGYPSVTSDRTPGDDDPADLEVAYLRRIAAISPASIRIVNYAWNAETREVAFDLESEFVLDVMNELRFGVIIAEDSLWGTSPDWDQANYYSGGITMCGFENKPDPVPASDMHYDHVARAILDTPQGTPNSLPANITAGSIVSYHYSYTLPAEWRYEKLHTIGFLLDKSSNEILNAQDEISSYVGINNLIFEKGVAVYPNPSSDFTNVAFTLDQPTTARVDVCDILGTVVYSSATRQFSAGQNQIRINNQSLASGMYVVKLTIGNQVISRKISVVK